MKRDKPSPLLEDVSICHIMGWTIDQLHSQPARFIEILTTYLGTLGSQRAKEERRVEEEIRRLRNRK